MSLEAQRQLSVLSIEDRCADVCAGCGLHMIGDFDARLRWLWEGGEIVCVGCGLTKKRDCARENATPVTYEAPTTHEGPDGGLRAPSEATERPQLPVLEAEPGAALAEPSSVSRAGPNRGFDPPDGDQVADDWLAAFNKSMGEAT